MSEVFYSQEESHDFSTWREGVELTAKQQGEHKLPTDKLVKVNGEWVPITDIQGRY